MSQPKFAQVAQTGFAAADAYDQHRPSYPPEAVETLLSRLEIKDVQSARVIDLAAGTGKFTVLLAQRPERYAITAIEPHAGMREVLERKNLSNVTTLDATAEDMSGIESQSVAAVTVAQGFHWISNMTALKEIHRVLQGAGVVGMIWNVEDYNAPQHWEMHTAWESTLRDVIWAQEDNHPRFRHEQWKAVFDEQNSGNPLFSDPMFGMPIGEQSIERTEWLAKKDIWSRYRTLSQIAILEGEELKRVEKIFWDAIDAPETETDEQGRVALHVRTHLAWASKIPDVPLMSDKAM